MEANTNLSPAQKELVAVGASVGAGCHPCLSHHLKAGVEAGLNSGHLLAAVSSAEAVASEATILVADLAREKLGSTPTPTLTPLEDALAALGAALGANDAAAIDLQLRAAVDLGASRSQLEQAIETARNVQENAGRIHFRKAEKLLDSIPAASTADTDTESDRGCGCGDQDATDATPDAASAGNSEAPGPAAMIAHCQRMANGLFGGSDRSAKTMEPPTATAATGCPGGEEVRR